MGEKRKSFLELESTPGENAMQVFEKTVKDLQWYIKSVGKAVWQD